MTPDGTLNNLFSFNGTNGYAPTALVQALTAIFMGPLGKAAQASGGTPSSGLRRLRHRIQTDHQRCVHHDGIVVAPMVAHRFPSCRPAMAISMGHFNRRRQRRVWNDLQDNHRRRAHQSVLVQWHQRRESEIWPAGASRRWQLLRDDLSWRREQPGHDLQTEPHPFAASDSNRHTRRQRAHPHLERRSRAFLSSPISERPDPDQLEQFRRTLYRHQHRRHGFRRHRSRPPTLLSRDTLAMNRPTADPSQEGSERSCGSCQFPPGRG